MENILTITFYTMIIIIIAFLARLKGGTHADFILGRRQNSGLLTALAAGTSDMSNWLMMSLPALIFTDGMKSIWLPISLLLGAYLNWMIVAPRLRTFSEFLGALTLPDFFYRRFGNNDKKLKLILAFSTSVFFIIYASASFLGGALLCQEIFGLPYILSLTLCTSFVVAYTILGGFLAVTWIDFFQGILMFLAIILVPFSAYYLSVNTHGESILPGQIHSIDFQNFTSSISWLYLLSCLSWGLGYFGQFHIALRFMAIKSVTELPLARSICTFWMFIALSGAVLTGIIGHIYFEASELANPETLFLKLSNISLNSWVAAWVFSAVLSAIMSSASAQLLLISSSLMEDVIAPILKLQTDKAKLLSSKLSLLFASLIAYLIALSPKSTIFDYVGVAWAGIGASFGPLMIFSLYYKDLTYQGALLGTLGGGITTLGLEVYIKYMKIGDMLAGFSLIPGFIVSSIIMYMFKNTPSSKSIEQVVFIELKNYYKYRKM